MKYFVQCCVFVWPPQLVFPDLHMTYTMQCTILQCAVLFCNVLYYSAMCCTVMHRTVLYVPLLYCMSLYYTILYRFILYCSTLYCAVPYYVSVQVPWMLVVLLLDNCKYCISHCKICDLLFFVLLWWSWLSNVSALLICCLLFCYNVSVTSI